MEGTDTIMTDIEQIRAVLIKRARDLVATSESALSAATTPDHKLAVLGNYGDVALTLLPHLCDEIDRLAARVGGRKR